MKKLAFLLCFLAIVANRASGGLTEDQLARFRQQLSDSDPKVRASALDELQMTNLPTAGNGILPLLSKALRDPEQSIRANASASLAMISLTTAPKFRKVAEAATDLRSYPPLRKELISTFNDADEETRKNALAAYMFVFEVSAAIQNDLVYRYELERPNSLFRTAILEALTIDGAATPASKALLMRVGSGPDGSTALAQVIQDSKAPLTELLPLFVNQFNTTNDHQHRALFARAIGKYGASAKSHIPALARAADLESDEVTRKTIKDAVAAIQAAK
jgi:HEAT repeat protein